jgi:AraC family transcriptional regulator
MGQPTTGHGARPYWLTGAIGLVAALSPQAISWEQAAAGLTVDLAALLLAETAHAGLPSATGELVWVAWQQGAVSCSPAVHPMLRIHSPCEAREAERVILVPSLPVHDPLLQHMALVLRVAIAGQGGAGQLYAASLVDALAVHFLKRYVAVRPAPGAERGGRLSYKLRRTIAYIQTHLAAELSLATLAAVAQTSVAHFARLFKHATGLTPHQYVITCRMEDAKRLLAETDVSLIDIGLQVGCADQSHFTALFRTHVAMTPKAYRDHARRA